MPARSLHFRFVTVAFAVALAVCVRWLLDAWLGPDLPLATLYGAVAVGVWVAGLSGGVLAAITGFLVCNWLFIEPRHDLAFVSTHLWVTFGAYAFSCAIIIFFGVMVQRSRRDSNVAKQQFQTITSDLAVGISHCGRDLRYRWVTQSYADWIGRPSSEIVGRPIVDVLGPAAFEKLRPRFEQVLNGEVIKYEERIALANMGPRWISAIYTPTRDSEGRIDGWLAVVMDIDQRRRTEESLRENEKWLARLQEVGQFCAASSSAFETCVQRILDSAIDFTSADKGSIQLFDEKSGTFRLIAERGFKQPFHHFFERAGPRDAAACTAAVGAKERIIVEDITTSDMFAGREFLRVYLDAGVRAVQSTPLLTSEGTLIGMISTFFATPGRPSDRELSFLDLLARLTADFLERRRIEQDLRATSRMLQAELADTRLLQEMSDAMIQEDDAQSLYEKIVEAALLIMRSDCSSLQMLYPDRGHSGELRLLAHRGFTAEAAATWEWVGAKDLTTCGMALMAGRRVVEPDLEACDNMAGSDALRAYLDAGIHAVQSTPLRSRNGVLVGMVSTHWKRVHEPSTRDLRLFDILARQAADLIERIQANEALKQSNRHKDEFLAMLSHELRNPLAPISYAAQMLKKDDLSHAESVWARDVLERQVRQMSRLLDDLLDVARITRGTIELRRTRVDLRDVMQHAIDGIRPVMELAGHTLSVEIPTDPIPLDADSARLSQVLLNLLSNAAKYTEPGGRIRLEASVDGDAASVRVIDNGIGIPPHVLDRIFDLFEQEDRSVERSRGGLGIGLTLARRLVDMHGGTLEAHSDGPGRGSAFIVRLPLVAAGAGAVVATSSPAGFHRQRPLRVLAVDDNRDSADGMVRFLTAAGHEVRAAYDGMSAVELATSFEPDAVVLDIGLPKLNGYDVAQKIRAQRGASVLLVALTGWGHEQDRRRARDAGFDHHLTKPVDVDELWKLFSHVEPRDGNVDRAAPNTR